MNRVKLESGKMISVESIWFIVFLFFAESREKQTQRIKWRPKTPQNLVKLSPPFFVKNQGLSFWLLSALLGESFWDRRR